MKDILVFNFQQSSELLIYQIKVSLKSKDTDLPDLEAGYIKRTESKLGKYLFNFLDRYANIKRKRTGIFGQIKGPVVKPIRVFTEQATPPSTEVINASFEREYTKGAISQIYEIVDFEIIWLNILKDDQRNSCERKTLKNPSRHVNNQLTKPVSPEPIKEYTKNKRVFRLTIFKERQKIVLTFKENKSKTDEYEWVCFDQISDLVKNGSTKQEVKKKIEDHLKAWKIKCIKLKKVKIIDM